MTMIIARGKKVLFAFTLYDSVKQCCNCMPNNVTSIRFSYCIPASTNKRKHVVCLSETGLFRLA